MLSLLNQPLNYASQHSRKRFHAPNDELSLLLTQFHQIGPAHSVILRQFSVFHLVVCEIHRKYPAAFCQLLLVGEQNLLISKRHVCSTLKKSGIAES
jgi:hypothetical protein